jgi:transposase
MWSESSEIKIWLYTKPVDMRKQFQGLTELTKNTLKMTPMNGDRYVFINRQRTLMKILYFTDGGYCLWAKKLELGRFSVSFEDEALSPLSSAQLQCVIEGILYQKNLRNKRLKRV